MTGTPITIRISSSDIMYSCHKLKYTYENWSQSVFVIYDTKVLILWQKINIV